MATDSDHTFDVIVIGLGPGGEHVAGSLAERGLRVLGVDRRLVGGECPYWGCIPSKMMIRAADALGEARRVDGLAGSVGQVTPDSVGRRQAHPRGGHRQLGRPGRRRPARGKGATVRPRQRSHRRPGLRRRRRHRRVRRDARDRRRTRARPAAVPPIEGLRDTPYWTNHEVIETTRACPPRCVVLGGGAIGCRAEPGDGPLRRRRDDRRGRRPHPRARGTGGDRPHCSRPSRPTASRCGGASAPTRSPTTGPASRSRSPTDRPWRPRSSSSPPAAAPTPPPSASTRSASRGTRAQPPSTTAARSPTGCGRSATSPARVPSRTSRCTRPASSSATSSATTDSPAEYAALPRVTFTDPEVGAIGMTEQQARDALDNVQVGRDAPRRDDPRLDREGRRPHQGRRRRRPRRPRRGHDDGTGRGRGARARSPSRCTAWSRSSGCGR